jgi:putative transposase
MHIEALTDDEWAQVEPLLDDAHIQGRRSGRPRMEARKVIDAMLWVLANGEGWGALPERFPSSPTCRRRFETWLDNGSLHEVIDCLREGGRDVSLDGRIGPLALKPLALPRRAESCGFAWRAPASWRPPAE